MRPNRIAYYFWKMILKPIYVFLYRPTVIHKEMIPTKGGVIVAGNHIHSWDPLNICISTKRQVRYLAKEFLFKYPVVGPLFKAVGCIKVYDHRSNPNAYKEAVEQLKRGEIVGIFPEGKVRREDVWLNPLKKGAVRLAKEANVKIVPCAVVGGYRKYQKDIKVVYGEPLDVSQMEVEEANELLYQTVLDLYQKNGGQLKALEKIK